MRSVERHRRIGGGLALGMVGLLALAGCSSKSSTSTGATTPAPATSATPTGTAVSLRAGLNDPTNKNIAILQYLPGSVTVTAGTTVSWQITGPEPHSVTFEPNNGPVPAPGSDESLFAPTALTGTAYDGTTLANSGMVPQGPQPASFSLAFSKPGTYVYHCVIHAQMSGTVTVVPANTTADTQAAITARGDTELTQWEAEGEAAAKTFANTPAKSTTNANGSKTWTVLMGTSTPHTDILAFSPVSSTVKPGDKVVFENDSGAPHTATFAGAGTIPQDPTSVTATTAAPGKSPQTLNATGFFNTGTLPPNAPPGAGPPLVARQYTYTVAAAGQYPFVCVYHAGSGMGGLITAG